MAHMLVVDDEPHIQELITVILTAEGHDVRRCSDGTEALAAVEERIPDLIVLDLLMPGMDGWHFLEELYHRGLRKKTRVVIVSGNYDAVSDAEGEPRVRHFLQKPFDMQSLVTMVNEALEWEPEELYDQRERVTRLAHLIELIDQVIV